MRNARLILMFCLLVTFSLELLNRVFLLQIAMQGNVHRNLKARVHATFAVFPYLVVCERRVSYVLSSFSWDPGDSLSLKTPDFQIARKYVAIRLDIEQNF